MNVPIQPSCGASEGQPKKFPRRITRSSHAFTITAISEAGLRIYAALSLKEIRRQAASRASSLTIG